MEFTEWLKDYKEKHKDDPKEKKPYKPPKKKRIRKLKKKHEGLTFKHPETGEIFYGRKAAADKVGCSLSLFTTYERKKIIPMPLRNANNYRIYTERQLRILRKLALKRTRHHRDAKAYGQYVYDTWYLRDDGTSYQEKIDAI